MADNWMDDRERDERDMRRADYVGRWPERGSRQYRDESRSFRGDGAYEGPGYQGDGGYEGGRDEALGGGRGSGGYRNAAQNAPQSGWQDPHYGGVSPAMRQGEYDAEHTRFSSQDYTRGQSGGRFYGDDRERLYRQEFGYDADAAYSPTRAAYHRQGYGEPGYGGYGARREEGPRDTRGERFEEAGRNAGDFLHRAGEKVAAWFAGGGEGRAYEPDFDRGVQGHRGKGPTGYKRSDERISDDAHERLTDDTWLDASSIAVSVSGGEVTLSGTVETREAKHRAERIVEHLSGVNHVQNNLRLAKGSFFTSPGSGYGDSVAEAQMRTDEAVANGTGGSGAGQSTAGRKN